MNPIMGFATPAFLRALPHRILVAALIFLSYCSVASADDPSVTGVRLGVNPPGTVKGTTRVVLELTKPVPYSAFLLKKPYRLVVDLPEVGWAVNGGSSKEKTGLVVGLRYGHFRAGNSRVVVDLKAPVKILRHIVLTGPDRIVFDIAPVAANKFKPGTRVEFKGWQPPSAPSIPLPRQKPGSVKGKRIIVIDAGHGGVDPGAVRGKIYEKRITLAIAAVVRDRLQKTGRYQVVMTRSRDVFLELRDRIAEEGDIFISLHADTHPKKSTRGGSVYTLSQTASDKEAAALAAKENKADDVAGITLDRKNYSDETIDILRDLQRRETDRHSVVFARMLTSQLSTKGVRLARRKAHRYAGFVVLKSPTVPSVLVELGYLSNKDDLNLLRTKRFRTRVADAVLTSVDRYFKHVDDLARK